MPTHNPYEQYKLELVNQARSDLGAAADRYGFDLGDILDRPLQLSIDDQNVKLDLNTETPAQPNFHPGKPEGQTAEPANPMMPARPVIPVDSGRPTTEPMDSCVAMGSRLRNEQDQMAEWLRGDDFRSMGLDWNIFGTGAGNGSMSDNDMAGQMMQDFFSPRVSGFGNMTGNANQMMCNADQGMGMMCNADQGMAMMRNADQGMGMMCNTDQGMGMMCNADQGMAMMRNADQGMGMMCGDQQRPIAAMRASDNFGNFNDCGNAVGFMPDDDMMMI